MKKNYAGLSGLPNRHRQPRSVHFGIIVEPLERDELAFTDA